MINKKLMLLLSCSLLSCLSTAFAGNIAVNGVATRGETMQAFTAVADDPSAIYYNPAGIRQVPGTEIEGGVSYIMPHQEFKNSMNGSDTQSEFNIFDPNLFATTQYFQNVTFGIGVYSPFARKTNFDRTLAVYNMTHRSEIVRLDVAPTVAFDLGKYVSAGVGFVASHVYMNSKVFNLEEDGDGYGYSGQGGILIKLPRQVHIGAVYRGRMTANLDGDGKYSGINGNYNANVHFPATYGVGVSWQPASRWLLSLEYDRELWSFMTDVTRHYKQPLLNQLGHSVVDGQDSDNYRIGIIYCFDPKNELRAGYSFVAIAVPGKNMIPAQPDYDTQVVSLGYSHYFEKMRLDLGYEFAFTNDQKSDNQFFPGTHQAHVNMLHLGLTYNFC